MKVVCAYCAKGECHLARHDIEPCDCPNDRHLPGTDEPEPFDEKPYEFVFCPPETAEERRMEIWYEFQTGGL